MTLKGCTQNFTSHYPLMEVICIMNATISRADKNVFVSLHDEAGFLLLS